MSPGFAGVSPPLEADLRGFAQCLREHGLRGALLFLNNRTPHRYTGVFRFDGDMLRSVALVDKWDASIQHGEDVPLAAAYCAHLHSTGQPVDVADGRTDPRFPRMRDSPTVSYCGAAILDRSGTPWGALCHFDTAPCQRKNSDMPLIVAAARMLYEEALAVA